MKRMRAITALMLLALALFGSGVFLHGVKPAPDAAKAPRRLVSSARHPKSKAEALSPAVAGVRQENALAFPLMLTGGFGLLVSALAALTSSRFFSAAPAITGPQPSAALLQASSQQPPSRYASRMREAERVARAKQQQELEARQAALQAEIEEARQRKAESEALREQVSRQFQEFFRTLPVPCFCFAASGKIIRWNAACETLYGIPAADALDSTLWDTIVPDSEREGTETSIRRVLEGQSLLGTERWDKVAGGILARLRCSMVPLHDAEGRIIGGLSAGVDITDCTRLEEQIAALSAALAARQAEAAQAVQDLQAAPALSLETFPETKGHPAFRARLSEEMERAARCNVPLSLVLLDLDGFTARNRTQGFAAGDLALEAAAAVIRSKIRTIDVTARLGADDYAIILPETGEAGARIAAERLRSGLADAGGKTPQTACFGVVQLSPDMASADEMVCRAQAALASARSCGPNTAVHFQDLPQKTGKPKARQPQARQL